VVILGGTRFIGRAIVEELAGSGHELLIVHRGELEPDDLPPARHVHTDRAHLAQQPGVILERARPRRRHGSRGLWSFLPLSVK